MNMQRFALLLLMLSTISGSFSYEFVHDGQCAIGLIVDPGTGYTLPSCAFECNENNDCGYFAFNSNSGSCRLYTLVHGCPDDNKFPNFNAYKLTDEDDFQVSYEFVHDGRCAIGLMHTPGYGYTEASCAFECKETLGCTYFATGMGQCLLYSVDSCSNDGATEFITYKLTDEDEVQGQCDAAANGWSSAMDDEGGLVVWCMNNKPWCVGSNPTSRASNLESILLLRDQVDLTLLQSDQTYFTNDGFKVTITESGVSIESQPDYVLITSGNQRCTADGLRLITDADECETAGIKLHDQGIISWRIVDGVEQPMVFQTHANANGQFPAGCCKETSWGMHLKLFAGDHPTAGYPGSYPSICATEPGPSAHINWCCDCQ